MEQEEILTNNPKYRSKNPVSRYFVKNYFKAIEHLVKDLDFQKVLEIGCGEGVFLHHLKDHLRGKEVHGIDLDPNELETAKKNIPFATLMTANGDHLPFADKSFDLVFCCEVLEHVEDPEKVFREMKRVSKKYCIVSVPNEPLWRILNFARGSYMSDWGNTPGHINHWSPSAFRKQVESHFKILETVKPLPWTGFLCEIQK